MLFELGLSINPIRTLSPAVFVRCYFSQCEQSIKRPIGSYKICIVPILTVLVTAEAICIVLHRLFNHFTQSKKLSMTSLFSGILLYPRKQETVI
jgi:fatty-acid desaturase